MKAFIGTAALALAIAMTAVPADAKGCIKGAVVGGAAAISRVTTAYWARRPAARSVTMRRTRKTRTRSSRSNNLDHSALMPAALMIGHHFAISAF